jgi:hypothetical protein
MSINVFSIANIDFKSIALKNKTKRITPAIDDKIISVLLNDKMIAGIDDERIYIKCDAVIKHFIEKYEDKMVKLISDASAVILKKEMNRKEISSCFDDILTIYNGKKVLPISYKYGEFEIFDDLESDNEKVLDISESQFKTFINNTKKVTCIFSFNGIITKRKESKYEFIQVLSLMQMQPEITQRTKKYLKYDAVDIEEDKNEKESIKKIDPTPEKVPQVPPPFKEEKEQSAKTEVIPVKKADTTVEKKADIVSQVPPPFKEEKKVDPPVDKKVDIPVEKKAEVVPPVDKKADTVDKKADIPPIEKKVDVKQTAGTENKSQEIIIGDAEEAEFDEESDSD